MIFHLLIVDDEPTIRKGLSSFIKWETMDCVVDGAVSDGAEAIEWMKGHAVDIVITDIRMPQVDGIELARYIHENCPEIKVILLTGYADFQYAQSAVRYAVTDFILKPTSRDKLCEAVRRAQEAIAEARNRNMVSEEDLAYLQEQFLQELTGMDHPSKEEEEKAGHYGISLGDYFMAAFQFGGGEDTSDAEGIGILKDMLGKEERGGYAYSYGNHLILWVTPAECGRGFDDDAAVGASAGVGTGPRAGAVAAREQLAAVCGEMIETMENLCAIRVCAGISSCHRGIGGLSKAAREAVSAGNMNFYEDSLVSLYDAALEENIYNVDSEYMMDLYQFENALKNWDFEGAGLVIRSLFARMKVNLTRAFEVKNVCVQIYYICTRILIKKELPPLDPAVLPAIHACTAIGQLEELTIGIYERERELLSTQGREWNPINEEAIRYIHGHLQENLSLETIAAHVHVNPSHLSRSFKKDCKESLTEYINRARIEKARELLMDSNTLAYEVAEAVGFHDPAYFSAIFKKYTGMSPKEFKYSLRGEEGKPG